MNKVVDSKEVKYKKWIIIISVVIPIVVAVLFSIRIPNVEPLRMLPPIYATINGFTALILMIAYIAIRK